MTKELTERMKRVGWVIRPAERDSDTIFVRGSATPTEKAHGGFVYAETTEDADQYDYEAGLL